MHHIRYYLDAAKRRLETTSDRELGRHLGWSTATVSQFRRGVTLPSDDNIVKLAEVAGLDPREALLTLSARRTTGRVRDLWRDIFTKAVLATPDAANTHRTPLERA